MGDPELRAAASGDRAVLDGWFRSAPIEHCFLLSQLEQHGLPGFIVLGRPARAGVFERSGRLLIPFGPAEQGAALGRALARTRVELRYAVGPLELVDAMWTELGGRFPEPQWLRLNRLYALDPEDVTADPDPPRGRLRPFALQDLGWLLQASARMDREDRGVDPLEEDPVGLERYLVWLVHQGLGFVWEEDGRLVFKAHAATVSSGAALVEGVYTVPEERGRHVAAQAMRAMCRALLARAPRLSLYVNDANTPAVRLYQRVGFRHVGHYRSILFPRPVTARG